VSALGNESKIYILPTGGSQFALPRSVMPIQQRTDAVAFGCVGYDPMVSHVAELVRERKLLLALDIDDTLIYNAGMYEREHFMFFTDDDRTMPHRKKFRDGCANFLKTMSRMFEMHIATHASLQYAERVREHLNALVHEEVILSCVSFRDSQGYHYSVLPKTIHESFDPIWHHSRGTVQRLGLAVDDNRNAWDVRDRRHVIHIAPASDQYSEYISSGPKPFAGNLPRVSELLTQVHKRFYSHPFFTNGATTQNWPELPSAVTVFMEIQALLQRNKQLPP
jgi:hypothetical protein